MSDAQIEDAKPNSEELRIRSEHRQALAKIESEREAELARLDLEATRRMPIAIRLFFDDRLYQRATAMAERMAEAQGIAPPHLLGKPGACFAVVSKSLAWNLDPFSVAQSTYEVGGRVAYEGKLVQAVLEASGRIDGGIHAEYVGDWSRVDGKFRIVEEQKQGSRGTYTVRKPEQTWTDVDETGLGITLRCQLRGENRPREFTFYLRQCYPRNASTWPTRPRQMMHYNAVRAFANTVAPSLLLGVPFRDEIDDDAGMRDVTPAAASADRPRQPLAAPTYVTVYSAHGEEFSLLPGEVEQWIIGQTDGATADELEALRDNNDHPGVVAGAKAALRELRQPKEERSGPPTERTKSRGRPKKSETIAREILAEIAATEPGMGADTLAVHQERLNAWAADPETHHLVNELVNAVQEHDAPADEAEANDDAPEPDPMDAESKPPASETTGSDDAGDAYGKWVMEVRKQAMGLPSVAHVGPQSGYRRGRLAEAGQWESPEDAEREVHAAFDAQMRKLGGGR